MEGVSIGSPKQTLLSVQSISDYLSRDPQIIGEKRVFLQSGLAITTSTQNVGKDQKDDIDDQQQRSSNEQPSPQEHEEDILKNPIQRHKYCGYYKKLAASEFDTNYFREDLKGERQKKLKDEAENQSSIKHFFEQFNFYFFIEFFLLHVLYFIVLGPLSIPLINLRGKALGRNLSFSGMSQAAFNQFCFYLLNLASIFLYFFRNSPSIQFEVEIGNLILVTFTRCLMIASKYATYDPLKILVLRTTILTDQQKNQQLFLRDWITQKPQVIHNTVYQCQRAFDIDPSLFFVQFMVDPEDKTHERLMNHDKILIKVRSSEMQCEMKPLPIGKEKRGQRFYFGYAILKDLIDTFQEQTKTSRKIFGVIIVGVCLFRAMIPIICRIVPTGQSPYEEPHEYFIGILSAIQVAFTYIIFSAEASYGFHDIQRKLFMQRQMSFMIAPRKLKNLDMVKTLPTINIFSSDSIKGWTLIRKVCMEYGKGYSLRVQGIFSCLGLWILFQLVLLILFYFKKINLPPAFEYQSYTDCAMTLLLIFSLLVTGAQINDVFDLQESILNSNKTIISDLGLVAADIQNSSYISQSYIYTKALEKIGEFSHGDTTDYIESLLKHYNFHINELLFDKNHNPFTLFGIKVTFIVLQSAAVAIGSVIATLLSQLQTKV